MSNFPKRNLFLYAGVPLIMVFAFFILNPANILFNFSNANTRDNALLFGNFIDGNIVYSTQAFNYYMLTHFYDVNYLLNKYFVLHYRHFNALRWWQNDYLHSRHLVKSWYLYQLAYEVSYNSNITNSVHTDNLTIYSFLKQKPLYFFGFYLFIITIVISTLFLSYLGLYGVFLLNFISLLIFWVLTIIYLPIIWEDNTTWEISLGHWFSISSTIRVNFEFLIDPLSYSYTLLTLTIAVAAYTYTFAYFRYEPLVERFLILLAAFVASMIFLVSAGNFIMLFLGWEMIGITSYFLINFWSTKIATFKAAFKAFTFNKFSDVMLLISIFLILLLIKDTNLLVFKSQIHLLTTIKYNFWNTQIPLSELISFFILSAAFIKSAQFGFHLWLPDSMEAPVPASALIHSATLVSAGVFLILRLQNLFELSSVSYLSLQLIGSVTAFIGGLGAMFQSDVKKILAYSTISHCGFLIVACSTKITEFVVIYLYVHGFFKAAVFLCVGTLIRYAHGYQDSRRMGNFIKALPAECFLMFIGLLNLAGLPFSLGFYMKHLLLVGLNNYSVFSFIVFTNLLFAALFGLGYSYKVFFYTFFDFKKANKSLYIHSIHSNNNLQNYTNSTKASVIIISWLFIISYIIILYLIIKFTSLQTIKTSFDENLLLVSQQYDLYTNTNNYNYFISYLNWVIIVIIIFLSLASFRAKTFTTNIYKSLTILFYFSSIFYMYYYYSSFFISFLYEFIS